MAASRNRAVDTGVRPPGWLGVSVVAGAAAVVLLLSLDRYGYFDDELYFLAVVRESGPLTNPTRGEDE
jgi:hypothetical protein